MKLGRYRLLESIGRGSMGTVHRAIDPSLDREVAIKTINTNYDVDPEVRERFYREARACGRLQHPNIITVFDLGEADNIAFIVMELLVGSDWRKIIQGGIEMPIRQKLSAMESVCSALSHAHRRGIIHRDIKPSNLFLTAKSEVKVLDFGIARLPSSRLTVANQVMGTMNYIAPEVIYGKPVDARSDLFSAGIVFFELLTYRHPFEAEQIPKRIVDGSPDSITDLDPRLPLDLARIFNRALSRQPDSRYENFDELAADLSAVSKNLGGGGKPAGTIMPLPSEGRLVRPVRPAFPPNEKRFKTPPDGEDAAEWYFSEALRLLPDFEERIAANDLSAATRLFDQLEAIRAVDDRFADALDLCRTRLFELKNQQQPIQDGSASAFALEQETLTAGVAEEHERKRSVQRPRPKKCPFCETPNRVAAANCIKCGAPLASQASDGPSPQGHAFQNEPLTLLDHRAPMEPDVPLSIPISARDSNPKNPTGKSGFLNFLLTRPPWLIAFATGTLTSLVGILVWSVWPISVRPAVATATVTSWRSTLYENASTLNPIAQLLQGQEVNVLALPQSRTQEWVSVQVVANQPRTPPGLILTKDLGNWNSLAPETKMALLLMFTPNDSATPKQIHDAIESLSHCLDVNKNSPLAAKAHLALAELYFSAGKLLDGGDRGEKLQLARAQIEKTRVDSSLKARADWLELQLKAWLPSSGNSGVPTPGQH